MSDQHKPFVATTIIAPPTPGNGTGLRGDYYNTIDLTGASIFNRIDPTVNFDWGNGSPAPQINSDNFSVRWSGQVEPAYSETYTFYTTTDDGVRLWINGVQIINDWTNHAPVENSATVTLNGGQRYDIRIEYFDAAGGAVAVLEWSSPSQTKQIIPADRLYPATTALSYSIAGKILYGITNVGQPDSFVPGVNLNATGTVNSLDATRIQQSLIGMQTSNIIGQWKFVPGSRQYNSFNSNLSGENYLSVLVGEVSGNWATAASFAEIYQTEEAAAHLRWLVIFRPQNQDAELKRRGLLYMGAADVQKCL